MKHLRFVVQLADTFGFDFGGEQGGIAAFANKGAAYSHAAALRAMLRRDTRVVDMGNKGKVEFVLPVDGMPVVAD